MTPWVDLRLTALDIESTSTDVETARIVTGAVAFVGGDQDTQTVTVLADPGVEIPAEATAVHHVSTEHARAHGLRASVAVAILLEAIHGRPEGSAVIGTNLRFDLTILDREARRHGLTPLSERGRPLHCVDIRVVDLFLDKYRAGKRTLADLCQEYGAKIDTAHDSEADAIAAARVAWWIGHEVDVFRRGRGKQEIRELIQLRKTWDRVRGNLPLLHEQQKLWAADQAADLERHFRENGRPECVPTSWPILPVPVREGAEVAG